MVASMNPDILSTLKIASDNYPFIFTNYMWDESSIKNQITLDVDCSSPDSIISDLYKKFPDENIGEYIREVNWPVWTDIYKDIQPNPKSKNLIITLASGSQAEEIAEYTKQYHIDYAKKCNADFVCLTGITQGWWGLEKYRVKPFVEAYDRTIFLDIDIIIKNDCENLFDIVPEGHIGIFDDSIKIENTTFNKPVLLSYNTLCRSYIASIYKVLDYKAIKKVKELDEVPVRYSTGVVVLDKNHSDIWSPIRFKFQKHHCDEQSFIQINIHNGNYKIFLLEEKYNCQKWFTDFDKVKDHAKIIHFATSDGYDIKLGYLKSYLDSI